MTLNAAIRNRKLGYSKGRIDIDFAIDKLQLQEAIKLSFDPDNEAEEELTSNGPLACSRINDDTIAVANEDGYINIMKTTKLKNISHWRGHKNAVFDINANPDKKTVVTASGDGAIAQWDVETKTMIVSIDAHHSSVKSISTYDKNTIASGSRDGSIQVHDLRSKKTFIKIWDAHRNKLIAKTRKPTVKISKTDPTSCVTNVAFDSMFPRIYSTGANDATIKLWDIRKYSRQNKAKRTSDGAFVMNSPYAEEHYPVKGRHCGYSHLLISSNKIYAACSDNRIYCYSNFGKLDAEPVKFTGYRYDTYLKLAVMDDRLLISGSKHGGATVWSLGSKNLDVSAKYYPETTRQPIGFLKANLDDRFDTNVIEPDWNSLSIITFRDDRLVCKWTMQSVLGSELKKLTEESSSLSINPNATIQMSDIIDVNVLRPSYRSNSNTSSQQMSQDT